MKKNCIASNHSPYFWSFPNGMTRTIWFSNWNFRFSNVNGKFLNLRRALSPWDPPPPPGAYPWFTCKKSLGVLLSYGDPQQKDTVEQSFLRRKQCDPYLQIRKECFSDHYTTTPQLESSLTMTDVAVSSWSNTLMAWASCSYRLLSQTTVEPLWNLNITNDFPQ